MAAQNHWIGAVSQDHVAVGVAGSFVQVNHGKAGPLARMHPGDGFVFYSPRASYPDGAAVQAFTAIGRVGAPDIATVHGPDSTTLHRRQVQFLPAHPAPVKPLIDALDFIRNKKHWGAAFRFGFIRIGAGDFARIAMAMQCDIAGAFPEPTST